MYPKVAWNEGDALYEAVFYRMKRGVGNVREQVWDVAIREEEYGHGSVWRDGCSCSEGSQRPPPMDGPPPSSGVPSGRRRFGSAREEGLVHVWVCGHTVQRDRSG